MSDSDMRLGLLVGVNQYDKLDPLKFCVQDVTAMKEILADASRGGFKGELLKVLVDGEKLPSKANIVDQLMLLSSKAGGDDELLFYFSGHGFEASGRAYLAPTDARIDRAHDTAIDIEELGIMLKVSKARTKVVILDSCYSGLEPGKASSGGMSGTFEAAIAEIASKGSGTIILTSCSRGEASYEEPSLGHGVFTNYLVEGLKGNADSDHDYDITVTEAYGYLRQKVDEYAIRSGNKQTPNLISSMSGDIVLVRVPQPPATQTVGTPKLVIITLSKSGRNYEADGGDPSEADSSASSDAKRFSGEMGGMLAEMFGPEKIEQVGSEYRFPGGSYSSTYGTDEFGENYSAWAIAKLNPDFSDEKFASLVRGWDPSNITIELNQKVDIAKSYSELSKRGFAVEEYIPGRRVAGYQKYSKRATVEIENRQVDSSLSVIRIEGNLAASMNDFSLALLISFVQ